MYFVWFLLPLLFILLVIWSLVKKVFKVRGDEHTSDYISEGVFCLVGFGIAVFIHKRTWFRGFFETITGGMVELWVGEWLIYPFVLVLMAYLQRLAEKRGWIKKPKERKYAKDFD